MILSAYRRPSSMSGHLTRTLLLGLIAFLTTDPSMAQIAQDFRMYPDPQQGISTQRAYFVYQAAAATAIHDAVMVRNEGTTPLRLSLFAADATTASHGGVAVATRRGDTPSEAGAWLTLSQTELHLKPGGERSVPFTVRIPDDLVPGEYAASLVAQRAGETDDEAQAGPMGVRFIPRFAVTVLVTVPVSGTAALEPRLEITDLRATTGARQQAVIGDLSNTGNDGLAKAEGRLTVRQTDGALVSEVPVRLGYFLAGDNLDYRVGLEQELAAGEYDVTLSLTHALGREELTRRLFLGELPEIPVLSPDDPTMSRAKPAGLPQWVFIAIGAASISISLLVLLLAVQSRRLARARLRV